MEYSGKDSRPGAKVGGQLTSPSTPFMIMQIEDFIYCSKVLLYDCDSPLTCHHHGFIMVA